MMLLASWSSTGTIRTRSWCLENATTVFSRRRVTPCFACRARPTPSARFGRATTASIALADASARAAGMGNQSAAGAQTRSMSAARAFLASSATKRSRLTSALPVVSDSTQVLVRANARSATLVGSQTSTRRAQRNAWRAPRARNRTLRAQDAMSAELAIFQRSVSGALSASHRGLPPATRQRASTVPQARPGTGTAACATKGISITPSVASSAFKEMSPQPMPAARVVTASTASLASPQ